ncbi:MAG: hypothetical protein K2X27_26895 [Candidatus Obscuribacterales bacterium]|nr:hypothetical protein [Candidatus Obscuribacterales bacterium]
MKKHHKNSENSNGDSIFQDLEVVEDVTDESMADIVGGQARWVGLGVVGQRGQIALGDNANAGGLIADQSKWLKGELENAYEQGEANAQAYGADLPEGEIKASINQLDSDMLENDVMLNAHGVKEFVSAWESNLNSQIPQGEGIPELQGFGHQIEQAWLQHEASQAAAAASDPTTTGSSGSVTAGLEMHQSTASGQAILGQVQAIVSELESANQGIAGDPDALIVKDGAKLLCTLEESQHTLTYAGEQQFMANVSEKFLEQTEANPGSTPYTESLSYGNITSSELKQAAVNLSVGDSALLSSMEQTVESDYAQYHLSGSNLSKQQLDQQVSSAAVSVIEQNVLISSSDGAAIINAVETQDNIVLGKQVTAINEAISSDTEKASQTGFYSGAQETPEQVSAVEAMAISYANSGELNQSEAAKIIVQVENQSGVTLARQEFGMLEDLEIQAAWAKNYIQGTAPTASDLAADISAVNQNDQGQALRHLAISQEIEQVEQISGLSGAIASKMATEYIEAADQQVQVFNLHDPNLSAAQIKAEVEQVITNPNTGSIQEMTENAIKIVEQESGVTKATEAFATAEAEINYVETNIPYNTIIGGQHVAQDLSQEATEIKSFAANLNTSELVTDVVRAYENTHGLTLGLVEEAIYTDIDTANSHETFISPTQVDPLVAQDAASIMNTFHLNNLDSSFVLQSRESILNSIVQSVEDNTGVTNALNENAHYIALQDLGSWNLGKEMAGLKYVDPTLEKAVVGTLWASTAVTALAGVASIASAGMAFFAAEPTVAAAEAGTTAATVAAETAGTSTISGALSEVSNAVADTFLKGMIQTFDAAAQISSISITDGLNAAANAVLRGMTAPLDSISSWSNATIDWARVVQVSASSGARELSYQELGTAAYDTVPDAAQIPQYEAELSAAQTELNSFRLTNFFVSRATPGPIGMGIHMSLGLAGVSGVGGIGYGTGVAIRDEINYLKEHNDLN